jgi:hypothetical protein
MTNEEAEAMFRADAIAAGLPPHFTPNDIAKVLGEWLESVPVCPSDPLWREVDALYDGYDGTPDYYERCADACRGVLVRQQLNGRTI